MVKSVLEVASYYTHNATNIVFYNQFCKVKKNKVTIKNILKRQIKKE